MPEAESPWIWAPDNAHELLEAIDRFPVDEQEVAHCGPTFKVSPFDVYAVCQTCGETIKLRQFADIVELADVFTAVFAWMLDPKARQLAEREIEHLRRFKEEHGEL